LHSQTGERILKPIVDDKEILKAVRHHHERYDGWGYPDGLQGERIPLLARIIAVADTFDAMTSERPYRKALTKEEACAEVERCRGTQFDPQAADAFLEVWRVAAKSG
jgi:putative two-component system response regulator